MSTRLTDARLIEESLEKLAAGGTDPAPQVYATLFSRHPEFETLFGLDEDGGVRGSMLQQALDCLLYQLEGSHTAATVMSAERFAHEGYGVPPERFETFFEVIRDTFRNMLGSDWSEDTDAAWTRTILSLRQSASG